MFINIDFNCTAAGSEILRGLYEELSRMLDARVVAANMYQRNALTLKELERIQSRRDRPVKAAKKLLNIIMEQPDAVFLCFLDVLKCSEQEHIYQRLVEGGYRGRKHIFATLQFITNYSIKIHLSLATAVSFLYNTAA